MPVLSSTSAKPGRPVAAMDRGDPERAWAAYEPAPKLPWNLARAAHLLRRAGFGATWDELQRALRVGPQRTVDGLLQPEADVAAKVFSGSGLDDLTSSGNFTGTAASTYVVEIDGTGTPDTSSRSDSTTRIVSRSNSIVSHPIDTADRNPESYFRRISIAKSSPSSNRTVTIIRFFCIVIFFTNPIGIRSPK